MPPKSTDNLGQHPVPITIQVPAELGVKLLSAAKKSGRRIQAEILQRLGESLGVNIDYRPPGRFPPVAEPAKKSTKKSTKKTLRMR